MHIYVPASLREHRQTLSICLRSRGPPLRLTKSQISHFVFAPSASVLNLSCRFCHVLRMTFIFVRILYRECFITSFNCYICISRANFCKRKRFFLCSLTLSRFLYPRAAEKTCEANNSWHCVYTCICTQKSLLNSNDFLRERDYERNN